MTIQLTDVGKRYGREWIFRHLNAEFNPGEITAITGRNGSGKSTLLRIISNYMDPTHGWVKYLHGEKELSADEVIPTINFCAPYVQVIEELTLEEHLKFHFHFRTPTLPIEQIAERAGLQSAWHKRIAEFSSGMKQRFKLSLSLFSTGSLILLDEPTSNLDSQGIEWYRNELVQYSSDNPIIIASNQRYEYDFAKKEINLSNQ